jgi:hypothetical protein
MVETEAHVDLRIGSELLAEIDKLADAHKRSRNSELLIALEFFLSKNKGSK